MIHPRLLVVVFCGLAMAHVGHAEDKTSGDSEIAAIRAAAESFQKAFDAGDANALAAMWTAEGEYLTEDGRRVAGRDAIEKEYADFFKQNKGARMTLHIDSIRLLSSDTAIEDGTASLSESATGPPTMSRYSVVHVKQNGQWRMASVRDAQVEAPSHYGRLADFDWLIGAWTSENHGVVLETKFQWIANKNFIEQSFVGRKGDQVLSSGKQIIGWDPRTGWITAWTFTSDGGHAVGRWSPHATGWQVETQGVLIDGTQTSAVNILTRLDDNAMSWRSVNRSAGAFRILDSEEVVLKRKK